MKDINRMRELKNVVNQLLEEDIEIINIAVKLTNETAEMYIHNLGNAVTMTGTFSENEYNKAKASRYVLDLIHAISSYRESENDCTFTTANYMYPNAIQADFLIK